jgi:hypothetical protein
MAQTIPYFLVNLRAVDFLAMEANAAVLNELSRKMKCAVIRATYRRTQVGLIPAIGEPDRQRDEVKGLRLTGID